MAHRKVCCDLKRLIDSDSGQPMHEIHEELEKILKEVPRLLLEKRLKEKLSGAGLKVPGASVRAAAEQILSGKQGRFTFEGTADLDGTIQITADDLTWVANRAEEFLQKDMPVIVEKQAEKASSLIYTSLCKNWPREYSQQVADLSGFRERLELRWGKALGKLRMLLTIGMEWGQEFNTEKVQSGNGSLSYHNDILMRLHARACQVTNEIILLLGSGFADGAMARWRTLHEIAVVASVITKYGDEIAERYMYYQIVESKRALSAYENCYRDLGYKPYPKKMAAKIRADYGKIIEKYGEEFGTEYGDFGWAFEHLKKTGWVKKRITFAMLEDAVGDKVMRAHYRMASYNVHASPKGIYFKLGDLDRRSKVLLAGASNAGLFEPAQNTAVTFGKLTLALFLRDQPSTDDLIRGKIVERLINEIPTELKRASTKLERDDRRYGKSV